MNKKYTEFINFFKKHNLYSEEAFKYLIKNTIYFDYREEDKRPYIGYHYLTDKNSILKEIKLYLPYISDYKTLLINIHEYIHALHLYRRLEKKYKKELDSEILPMLYEKIYLLENPNEILEEFLKYLNTLITENSPQEYKIALLVQEELLKYYIEKKPSFEKLQRKARKLTRKYTNK